jgi:transposase
MTPGSSNTHNVPRALASPTTPATTSTASAASAASIFGLPSLRALDAGSTLRIWLCLQRTDMRCGFDRLAMMAQQITGQDPLSGHLFLFRNRSGDRLKLLHWDRDGYVLWYKRLEEGVFKFPRQVANTTSAKSNSNSNIADTRSDQPASSSLELRPSELAMLLDGIDLSSVKRSKRYRRRASAE